jgi:hypothetical protein
MDNDKESYIIPVSDLAVVTNVDDLTCIICLNICFKPVMVKCCERLICSECIKSVLKYAYKCPYCNNQNINFDKPPKIISRLFENLIFKCTKTGCQEKIKYYFYFDHMYNTCSYKEDKYKFCKDCESIVDKIHTCKDSKYICPIDNKINNSGEANIIE